jgi:hypothetical protein
MNFLTCHIFGVFASYFHFAAFSRLAFPAPTRRKTFKTAAERSSLGVLNTSIIEIHGDFCFTKRGSSGSVPGDKQHTEPSSA